MDNDLKPVFGGIASETDYRDLYAAKAVAEGVAPITLPAKHRTDLGPVLHQRKIPSCVSHSVVYLMQLYWYKRLGKWIDFSPRFLDILSSEPDIPLDGGRRPRNVLKMATKFGCCTTALLPNDTNLSTGQYRNPNVLTAAMFEEAEKYKIPGYFAVDIDEESTKLNIFLHGSISTLFKIGEEMYTSPTGKTSWLERDINPLRVPKLIISGHQMNPVGWDDKNFSILRNEWGPTWNRNGEADFRFNTWKPYILEQWAIADIPQDTATFLKNLPSPSEFHYEWRRDLKFGDYSDDVKFAQIALMILGQLAPVPPDQLGFYGPKTRTAVGQFQRSQNIFPLAPDNIGPRTRRALNILFAL